VVFDQHGAPRDTRAFAQQADGIIAVVEYVHEEDEVEGVIGVGNMEPVEAFHVDVGVASHLNFDTANRDVGTSRCDLARQQTIATAHVQEPGTSGYPLRELTGEDVCPSGMAVALVEVFDQPHRRPIPRILTKKPERIV
jgi:hypothetical protein